MDASLLTFLGVSAAVIVAPGPDTALTVRNTFLDGRHSGILTAAGVDFEIVPRHAVALDVITNVGLELLRNLRAAAAIDG